jgi:Carbon-nitrogen hydrolase
MKVAAYQAPLLPGGSLAALELIRDRVKWCETAGVAILCCPEAVLGGLADDAACPVDIAIDVESGELEALLAPLASKSVTVIVGFTETVGAGKLYNSAAVFHDGKVVGLYRKRHPAIRRSVYSAGDQSPVFTVGPLSFGIMICNDSNYPELAADLVARGATAIFLAKQQQPASAKGQCGGSQQGGRYRAGQGQRSDDRSGRCCRPHGGPGLVRLVRHCRCLRNAPPGGRDVERGHPRCGSPRQVDADKDAQHVSARESLTAFCCHRG